MTELYLTAYNGAILGPIAKVLGVIMNWIYVGLHSLFGVNDIWVTIVVFTILIYMALFPLTWKQQKFSMLQQKMQPEMKAIQKKYQGKRDQESMMAQQDETQALYDKYGISPTGSCIQMVIQMPILFALYRVFYNVPAYITSVKGVFTDLVTGIQATGGYEKTMQAIYKAAKINNVKVDFTVSDKAAKADYIVDVLYKLGNSGWDMLQDKFPALADTITATQHNLAQINYFFNLNISDTPWNLMKQGFAADHKDFLLIIAALLIPAASWFFQFLTVKLMPTASTGQNDQMDQQMKMMNTMMPLMSLFFAFTVPVGLVLYWIVGSIIRCIQQAFLNKHFEKMDLDAIIEKNKEKAKKKAAKRGERREQIYSAATTNTRKTMSQKAGISSEKQEALNRADEARKKAGRNSLAAKANLVNKYNNGHASSKTSNTSNTSKKSK